MYAVTESQANSLGRPAGPSVVPPDWVVKLTLISIASHGVQIGTTRTIQFAVGDFLMPVLVMVTMLSSRAFTVRRNEVLAFAGIMFAFALGFLRAPEGAESWALVRFVGLVPLIGFYLAGRMLIVWGQSIERILTWIIVPGLFVNFGLEFPPTSSLFISLFEQKNNRLSGALFDPNFNGVFLAVCAYCLLFGLTSIRGAKALILTALTAVMLVLTFSRGGYLVFAALLIWRLLATPSPRQRLWGIGALVFGTLGFQLSGLAAYTASHFARRPETVSARFEFINASIELFMTNVLFGGGLGSSFYVNGHVTHSTPFFIIGDVGAIGLAFFTALVLYPSIRGIWLDRPGPSREIYAIVLATGLGGLTFEAMYQRHWWALAGMAAALNANSLRRNL